MNWNSLNLNLGYGINIEKKKIYFQGLYISSLTLQKVNLLII